jgi:precorrin-8X/cobalt-precorrin-8 methylmutase
MPQAGVVILCHGSRGERGKVEVPETLGKVTDGVKPLLPPGVEVAGAALQFNHPTLEEAVEALVARGVPRIIIMPYFLLVGRHITEDIPGLVEELKDTYRGIKFSVAKPLGSQEYFIGQVARRIEEAAPELWLDTHLSPISPEAIEQQSMAIVESILTAVPGISEEERLVVKRVVHASGDPQVTSLLRFSPSAISDGLSAIAKGSPIFTDTRMVATGINSRLAAACGCSLTCAMAEMEEQKQAKENNTTRAAAAMYQLGSRLSGAIVAIGNAPTALLALLDLIDHARVKPALVVGMPVGFVQARESKAELVRRDVPHITVAGTRGGSAMAVATVNALLKIAVERNG